MKKNRKKLSKDDFAKLMMDRIHQAGEKGEIVYEREEFRLGGVGNRSSISIFLGNAYQEYYAVEKGNRDKVLKNWVRNWFVYLREVPEEFEDAKPDLMPVIRSRSYFDLNSLQAEVKGGRPLNWPYQVLGEHFGVGLVYDMRGSMRSVPQQSLDTWGITFYEALEAAKENLVTLPSKFLGPGSGEGVYWFTTGDSYDASRLLLTDMIRQLRLKGDPIAMIPNRETLIVVGAEDEDGLAGLVRMAPKALKEPRSISGIALRLDGDEWTPWLPAVSHPSFKDYRNLYIQALAGDYAWQNDLLDKLHTNKGEDIFVATYSLLEGPDGTPFSYAVWADGADPWLPATDVVMLLRIGEEKPTMVAWQKVVDVAGDLMEAADIYPHRYRVRGFPTEEQLKAMGNLLE